MKKITPWVIAISFVVFVVDWGVMGIKLLDGNYNITLEAYIALVDYIVLTVFVLIKRFSSAKCSHCGKVRFDNGKYCSYCGKEV